MHPILAAHQHRAHASSRTNEYLYNQLIPYIGNKRKLLWLIDRAVKETGTASGFFVDFFAGSGVVARYAKQFGFSVLANDWEPYAAIINRCYTGCSILPSFRALGGPDRVFDLLNRLPPQEGYITRTLCPIDDQNLRLERDRLFFTHSNGMRIDSIREQVSEWAQEGMIDEIEVSVLLAVLLYAVSYVSNTSGLFKGFHRGWGGATKTAHYRILSNLTLKPPILYDNGLACSAECADAQSLAERLAVQGPAVDIAYLDPPYNQHPYGSNYHVLNTVALWDKPDVPDYDGHTNKSAIRKDWSTLRRSAYNYSGAMPAYSQLIGTIRARYILTSYSTDGKIPVEEMIAVAAERGRLTCVMNPYKRYRVSTQRMSKKPVNVEFVLTIETGTMGKKGEAAAIIKALKAMEERAVSEHRESEPYPLSGL